LTAAENKGVFMKKARILTAYVLIAIMLFLPITVRATGETLRATQAGIMINGEMFEPWGFLTEARLYLCLFDIAYLLNGTSAQFNIRTPIDDRWDFWIVRGEAYTPTGTEFQPMENIDYWGYYAVSSLVQSAVIGIDGEGEPAISLVVSTIQDNGGIYFEMPSFASILGFDSIFFHSHYFFCSVHGFYWCYCSWEIDDDLWWPEINAAFNTETRAPLPLPVQPVELLHLLRRISGLWVDRAHFYSPIIDESTVLPAELRITTNGINKPISDSVAPMRPDWSSRTAAWEHQWWYPVSMHTLENGLVELTVNQPEQAQLLWNATWLQYSQDDQADFLNRPPQFYNHRIVVDPREEQIDSFTLYIGDTPHIMYRRDYTLEEFGSIQYRVADFRYQVLPVEDGGIMLRYLFGPWSLSHHFEEREFRIYRSHAPIEHDRPHRVPHSDFIDFDMELLFSQREIDPTDRIVFEFVDLTAQLGNVYYYTLWNMHADMIWTTREALHRNMWSIRVVVNEIFGIPKPEVQVPENEETEPYVSPTSLHPLEYDVIEYDVVEPYESPTPAIEADEPYESPNSPQTPLEENRSRIWVFLLPILIVVPLVGFVFYLIKVRSRRSGSV